MNRNYRRLIGCAMIIFIVLLSHPSTNYPQEGNKETVKSIMLEIKTPKGRWIKASTAEGEMITVVDASTGMGYGFVPVVRSMDSGSVEVKTLQVTGKAPEVNVLKQVESTEIKVGAQQQLSGAPVEIKVLAITEDFKDQAAPSGSVNDPPVVKTTCCVFCFGENICAGCIVMTDCGCCCSGCCGSLPKSCRDN